MSLLKGAKQFFGLEPDERLAEDAYFEDSHYASQPLPGGRDHLRHDEYGRVDAAPQRDAYRDNYRPRPAVAPVVMEAPRTYEPAIVTVTPKTFNQAPSVGDAFRSGDAVTFELTDTDPDVARRILDFASGLCFALEGLMHKLPCEDHSNRTVFALVPHDADVTISELQRAVGLRL